MSRSESVRRVLWVADNLTTGGIGTVSRYAAEALSRIPGWAVTLVSLRPPHSDTNDPVTGVRLVSLGLGDDAAQPFLDWLERNPHDLVLTNHVPQIEASFRHIPTQLPHVIAIHDTSRSHTEMALRNAPAIDGVVAVAHHVASTLQPKLERAHFHGILETIHNGAQFPPRPTRSSPSGPMRLLYVGSMDPFKGIMDLAHVLERCRRLGVPVTLAIAGGSSPLLEERLRRAALDRAVTWAGWIDHEQCYELAKRSEVLLMPSRKEAFGMVTIEAMAMGCVPIAYDIASGSREIIEHRTSGLLIPLGDFAACARAIKHFHSAPDDWLRMSVGAMRRARSAFTADSMAMKLAAFLVRVIDNAAANPAQRVAGRPPSTMRIARPRSGYQLLPSALRERVRGIVGDSPRLCHWLLNRW